MKSFSFSLFETGRKRNFCFRNATLNVGYSLISDVYQGKETLSRIMKNSEDVKLYFRKVLLGTESFLFFKVYRVFFSFLSCICINKINSVFIDFMLLTLELYEAEKQLLYHLLTGDHLFSRILLTVVK